MRPAGSPQALEGHRQRAAVRGGRYSLTGRRVCPPPARLRAPPLSCRLPLKGGVAEAEPEGEG